MLTWATEMTCEILASPEVWHDNEKGPSEHLMQNSK